MMTAAIRTCCMKLWRTKPTESVTSSATRLNRCLGLLDLIVIGVSGMVGSGIYVMTGFALREQAGPSTVLSFLLAAFVVLLIAACYTELASKLHKTGSTYLYLYLTLGEFPAFFIGLSTMIMTACGGAVNARAWSSYFDLLVNNVISNFTMEHIAEWDAGPPIARYPDFLAVLLIIVITVVVSLGANFSTKFSTVFVFVNLAVLVLVSVCGVIFGNLKNWTDGGVNGFFPFGWSGTVKAAAGCFWAFSGFDLICCAVEETQNPKRNIPIAMSIVVVLVTFLYVSATAALCLMVPYYSVSESTPMATVFVDVDQQWGYYVVTIGTLCAFTTSILSTFYSFVRIGLAMAEDGLLFAWFRKVSVKTKVPVLSAVFCGVVEGLIASSFDINNLISFSVNLILLSYCAVCASVIIISYRPQIKSEFVETASIEDYLLLPGIDVEEIAVGRTPGRELPMPDRCIADSVSGVKHMDMKSESERQSHTVSNCSVSDAVVHTDNTSLVQLDGDSFKEKRYSSASRNDQGGTTAVQNFSDSIAAKEQTDVGDNDRTADGLINNTGESLEVGQSSDEPVGYLRSSFICLTPCMICKNGKCALFALGMMSLFMLGLSFCITYAIQPIEHGVWWSVILLVLSIIGIVVFMGIICVHKHTYKQVVLKLHCVPFIPSLAVALCFILLVANSTPSSWIGCAVLLLFAAVIYGSYSVHHSKLNHDTRVVRNGEPQSGDRLLEERSDSEEEVTSNNL